MTYRDTTGYALEPIQQSMASLPEDNQHLGFLHMELGVIVSVHPADSSNNSSAMQSQVRRGWRHECTVQIVSSGRGGDYRLANVVIPPTRPSGMDNYEESLPRPSTKRVSGGELDLSMQRNDAYDLDGDWCVVGFLNGDQDQPFIVSWWPNPNNKLDPQTSGEGSPNSQGNGSTLNQKNRYFSRTNGVEVCVTPSGDVYFDTNFAGTSPDFSEEERGRYKRDIPDTGGSIKVALKPEASFEIDWNKPANGVGILDNATDYLVQENPKVDQANNTGERENTYLKVNNSVLELLCKAVEFKSDSYLVSADTEIKLKSPSVVIGKSGGTTEIRGNTSIGDGDLRDILLYQTDIFGFQALQFAATNAPSGSTAQNAAAIKLIQEFLNEITIAIYSQAS